MDVEIAQLVGQAAPYVSTAVGAYGAGVLTRAEDAAVGATAHLGRRILGLVWRRRDEQGRGELEAAVEDVAAAPKDDDAGAALRQQIKRALRDDDGLRAELAALLAEAGSGSGERSVHVTASGERSIAARTIGTAVTGDGVTLRP
ncbi:hypothetical protein [Streptomyces sp. VRA16 Mangrove soil]|uniref:hypothetical protein n=1 Tax=Streptomyces sp. VRA16 Mangrove soil TaxID=2817434 RepID=UPI001A9F7E11|nr:hypothetical protein [Streptomyces sp. VRA16 Mangrove soil]MBO1332583.1 hypothetical protein [Streptomyces sp. VRA16 Mangrove soil]